MKKLFINQKRKKKPYGWFIYKQDLIRALVKALKYVVSLTSLYKSASSEDDSLNWNMINR